MLALCGLDADVALKAREALEALLFEVHDVRLEATGAYLASSASSIPQLPLEGHSLRVESLFAAIEDSVLSARTEARSVRGDLVEQVDTLTGSAHDGLHRLRREPEVALGHLVHQAALCSGLPGDVTSAGVACADGSGVVSSKNSSRIDVWK